MGSGAGAGAAVGDGVGVGEGVIVGVGVVEREPKGKNNAFFWAYSGQTKYYDTGNLAATKIPDKISNHA